MTRFRFSARAFAIAAAFVTSVAFAGDEPAAQAFVKTHHEDLVQTLRLPPSPTRDAKLDEAMGALIDFDDLVSRAFGDPCPQGVAKCTNHWAEFTPKQRDEVRDLLKKLVRKQYKKNLQKTTTYELKMGGSKVIASMIRVRTEAVSTTDAREAPIRIDYFVMDDTRQRVVDVALESSSMTKNYYEQFHKMLVNTSQGYPHVIKKLKEKLASD